MQSKGENSWAEFPRFALAHAHSLRLSMEKLLNFIDGEFVATSDHLDSYNPATGEVHLHIPDSGEEDVEKAVQAALRAFKT